MKRSLVGIGAAVLGTWVGWRLLVRRQGDSEVAFDGNALADPNGDARSIHGEITVRNRGKAGAVVHKITGRIVAGPPGRVLVTRKDSRSPERGWWRSNCLLADETCIAEVDVELDEPATVPVIIELDAHDIGRRPVVHRIVQVVVPVPGVETVRPPTGAGQAATSPAS